MPLWTIHHSHECLATNDRRVLATGITELYRMLPRFYVDVVFTEAEPDGLFVGGVARDRFVRIAVDHIARSLPDAQARRRWMDAVGAVLGPFMAERTLSWELHIDETDRELWLIEGLRPPGPGTSGERRWIEAGAPVPFEDVAHDSGDRGSAASTRATS